MSTWVLTDEVKDQYTPIVQEFIDKVEAANPQDTEELLEIDLSGTVLNPYTLEQLLKNLGYESSEHNYNGWQMDYWITMSKDGAKPLDINGTGITFELKLSEVG
ncbi:hypothetical protein [Bacillus subtilis]|uniref:hypothetical protein n=1 Tax=Bacillus subtilis TaxID=1423 RepID=UPI000A120028|nr:hypothetical protein [Bacillus subtilis]MEC2266445.1 hypothetical protein [Bacillus subtilis]MEC4031990.1 hypothetical protein [Bacillus subtilis]MUG00815.1 hypothetical protein [Bacillus tequilensis]